jgi:hypothetical protein
LRRLWQALGAVACVPALRGHLDRLAAGHGIDLRAAEDAGYRLEDGKTGTVLERSVSSGWLAGCQATLADLAAAAATGGLTGGAE